MTGTTLEDMPGIAEFSTVVLDCPDAEELARFYSELTGFPAEGDPSWMQLDIAEGPTIAFQRVDNFRPPQWPGQDHPQQLHLDFYLKDLDEGESKVLSLGAVKAGFQPGDKFRVFLDPAGHPFCLCLD